MKHIFQQSERIGVRVEWNWMGSIVCYVSCGGGGGASKNDNAKYSKPL